MTPEVKRKRLQAIGECLQNSLAADSLPADWQDKLFGRHLARPERDLNLITTLEVTIGGEAGWFMVWQKGGGFTFIIWTNKKNSAAELEADDLRRCLQQTLVPVQVRWTRPHEFLRVHGYKLDNGTIKN